MKNILASSISGIIATILLFSLASCDQNSIATQKVTASKKAVGRWNLVSITSGWTGKTDSPKVKIDMSINEQQQATVYKSGVEVYRFQYIIEAAVSETLQYTLAQENGTSPTYFPEIGTFEVSSKQLIMDSRSRIGDGPVLTFERR